MVDLPLLNMPARRATWRGWLMAATMILATTATAGAGDASSAYTKYDFVLDCSITEEYEAGLSAICTGYLQIPIHFSEGDLRQMVQFGTLRDNDEFWQSFAQFNRANQTIEWRLHDGDAVAVIQRWFIENTDPETGSVDAKTTGQVLVISTIGTLHNPVSCHVGYVDARANSNANLLARSVADVIAPNFDCAVDTPKFHGVRGPLSGQPTAIQ